MANKPTVEELPIFPLRGLVCYPGMLLNLLVGHNSAVPIVDDLVDANIERVFLSAQENTKEASTDEIYSVGCIAEVVNIIRYDEADSINYEVTFKGIDKAQIVKTQKKGTYNTAQVEVIKASEVNDESNKLMAYAREQIKVMKSISSEVSMMIPELLVKRFSHPRDFLMLFSSLNMFDDKTYQSILEIHDDNKALKRMLSLVNREVSHMKDHTSHHQDNPVGVDYGIVPDEFSKEIDQLQDDINNPDVPDEVREEALKQLHRAKKMPSESSEYSVIMNYVAWLKDIPWGKYSTDSDDLKKAKEILDYSHFGMEKVKDRILEFLAVKKLKTELPSTILCLVGPPGVGKTTLVRSIAEAVGREYVRISLGGVRDEAEIRGHRRTYVGSMPGQVIHSLKKAGTLNPVVLLDEVDKISNNRNTGNVSACLLELLDPDLNKEFKDTYINLPVDLSQVLFVCSANDISMIEGPLRDRLEIIRLDSYTLTEKLNIANGYLVPQAIEEHGLPYEVRFNNEILESIIEGYTREAGVRDLKRNISKILRKIAKNFVMNESKITKVTKKYIVEALGPSKDYDVLGHVKDRVGQVNGLAYSQVGGSVLPVQVALSEGKGGFFITGKLGDVMKESVKAALTFAKNYDSKIMDEKDLHVHFPEGAIPKDGPSAGIAIFSSIMSVIQNEKFPRNIAMTGEITIFGDVLPVGGLKEKLMAAVRDKNINKVYVPLLNKNDIEELSSDCKKGLEIRFIQNVKELDELKFEKKTREVQTSI